MEFCLGEGQKNAKNNLGSHQHPCLGLTALTTTDTSVFAPSEAPAWDLQEIKLSQQPFISSCGLCRAALQSLGDSLRALLLSRASSQPWTRPQMLWCSCSSPTLGSGCPQPSEHPLRPSCSPFCALCLPRLPQKLPQPGVIWFEGGWMGISSPLQNWSGRICFFSDVTSEKPQGCLPKEPLTHLGFPSCCSYFLGFVPTPKPTDTQNENLHNSIPTGLSSSKKDTPTLPLS